MNTPRNPSTTLEFPSAGFSLIEVLVTTWLIGVGMLGMAALQSRAIANGDDHLQRSTAAMLVNDLLAPPPPNGPPTCRPLLRR
ncbi:prepilin-type N-terminal cleavage/methylation domain-containing protein [Pseudomonas sp. GV071]|uniref:type IV pilus modification PilV family protein n=1 Tax=Pseudomonas sp. GV071 TaxID=2135754 RepID=UPI000D4F36C8|nr:prepilin-type N-terminal cleavage/methylation domain-containing protein [Pseudomonas sp. GV071]PTQ68782.1 prepilin-type N-terminal cleavage/methylation domain-containing protein [Pseudomonas sp. GV071]